MDAVFKEFDDIIKCYNFIIENTTEYTNYEDILLILDIDNTITYTDCAYVFWPNIKKYYDVYKEIQQRNSDVDINLSYVNIILSSKIKIFDNNIYKLINDFNSKKIALTATVTGSFLQCKSIEELRYNNLKNCNISFENEFKINDSNHIIFDNFPKYLGQHPTYYKGILFSNSEKGSTNKGQVLNEFLKRINYNPKCIIFIDDNSRNHEYLTKELEQYRNDVKFISILYTGTYDYAPEDVTEQDFIDYWENCFALARLEKSKRNM